MWNCEWSKREINRERAREKERDLSFPWGLASFADFIFVLLTSKYFSITLLLQGNNKKTTFSSYSVRVMKQQFQLIFCPKSFSNEIMTFLSCHC